METDLPPIPVNINRQGGRSATKELNLPAKTVVSNAQTYTFFFEIAVIR
jgi:hypothetical protein